MKHKGRMSTIATIAACILFLAIAAVCILFQMAGASEYDSKTIENRAMYDSLKTEYDSIQQTVNTKEDVEAVVYSAADAGNQVADFQNMYSVTMTDGIKAIAEKLDAFFDSDSKAMRVPWFSGPVKQGSVTWQFETTYSFSSKNADVLWTCWDSLGQMLAYTTGKFNVETKLFSDVETFVTLVGQNSLMATGQQEVTDPNNVANNILGAINGSSPSPSPTPSASAEPTPSGDDTESSSSTPYPAPQISPSDGEGSPTISSESSASGDDGGSQVTASATIDTEGGQ